MGTAEAVVPDIITFRQDYGSHRFWVPEREVEFWLDFWQRGGQPTCRWTDYRKWGGFFPPWQESATEVMLYPKARLTRRRR